MDHKSFIQKFVTIFDETDEGEVSIDTPFRDLKEWSSLNALGLLAMVEEEYGVNLTNQDIRDSVTVEDLFDRIQNKAQ